MNNCSCGKDIQYEQCCGEPSDRVEDSGNPSDRALYAESCEAALSNRPLHGLTILKALLLQNPFHKGAFRLLPRFSEPLRVFSADELATVADNVLHAFPDDQGLGCGAAQLYRESGRLRRSEETYRRVLEQDSRNFVAHIGMADLCKRGAQLDQAEYHYRQALYQHGIAPKVVAALGACLNGQGRHQEAEHYFRMSLAQAPMNVTALLAWSQMEEARGDTEKAWRLFDMARKHNPGVGDLVVHLSTLHRRGGNYRQAITALDSASPDDFADEHRANYFFERHRVLDKMKQFPAAFEAADEANRIKRERLGFIYEEDILGKLESNLKSAFSQENAKTLSFAPTLPDDEKPIFICGFTRSGTSMLEQILSFHSQISGGDELPFVNTIARDARHLLTRSIDYPMCLIEGDDNERKQDAVKLRSNYLTRLRMTSVMEPGAPCFTDKMPMNELHLGLIHMMFPQSKVIHVFRHPLDSVLSTFFTDATHGGTCAYSLQSAARHYMRLFDMTTYYRQNLDLSYLQVRYEDLVDDLKPQVERIFSFLDLPFESQCLEFHKNPRFARTASYAQVKQPLYSGARYRYRHYLGGIQDIIPVLRPAIEALGYDVNS
ncbi:MAG: sulfotransferase [Pseudomonadota bacterium]